MVGANLDVITYVWPQLLKIDLLVKNTFTEGGVVVVWGEHIKIIFLGLFLCHIYIVNFTQIYTKNVKPIYSSFLYWV